MHSLMQTPYLGPRREGTNDKLGSRTLSVECCRDYAMLRSHSLMHTPHLGPKREGTKGALDSKLKMTVVALCSGVVVLCVGVVLLVVVRRVCANPCGSGCSGIVAVVVVEV